MSEPKEGQSPRFERPETSIEQAPDREEVLGLMREFVTGELKITRTKEDAGGLLLLEVAVENEAGEVTEYSYRRGVASNPDRKDLEAQKHSIEVFYYDKDGMPEGGTDVAKHVDGVWKIAKRIPGQLYKWEYT